MPIINYKTKEINCKIVYVGPSLGGKTTNIQFIHHSVPSVSRTPLQSINTDGDRTLFFDYFALEIAEIQGFKTKFLIYGVPGQPYYKSTRKMVLNGVDGLVFIADSDKYRMSDNLESLLDMKSMLKDYGYNYNEIPLVLQYNKRDLPSVTPANEMEQVLNDRQCDSFEAVAIQGRGVIETFKAICASVVERLNKTLSVKK
ncbi:MAG TPA: GTPase domain-containing protein [Candidatus Sumerlaeota bacterium]|nr:MAG: Mutual gliding-motility protein MglA [candidate division BRC1 bacterium ADurb.Bin183]HOE62844.1 GTPase domain-containing protein [Candidatus Sumerlaeota bacterium]HRR31871.1 GTPase domain-containing protein [Candidatus Sumerlaeia bacterium]HON50194.1 GTPase domain-containing protein [Candidatus Sumerlaeota bacterium]HOR63410.1 GTPase domain-containing protein [Candidatus Sumerlaeota bacterium]